MKLYQKLAGTLKAIENCKKSNNAEWLDIHTETLEKLVLDYMPHGSGIDAGTLLDESSTPNRLVFLTSYHHMNENGYYDGWTEHKVIITPSLAFNFDMKITGRDRNYIKEYLYQVYEYSLNQDVES